MLKSAITLFTLCAFISSTSFAQTHSDWQQSLADLHPGDQLHISAQAGPVDSTFLSYSAQELTVASGTFKKEDILEIDRLHEKGHGSRGKHVALGAAIGAGGGAGFGAILVHTGSCKTPPCFAFGTNGMWIGGFAVVGLVIGAVIGAFLPGKRIRHEVIYALPKHS